MRMIVALAFLGHGLVHVTGFLVAWTWVPVGFTDAPWVLPGEVKMQSAIGHLFGLLWLVAMVTLVCAGLGLLTA